MDKSTVKNCYGRKSDGGLAIAVLEVLEFDIFFKDQYLFINSIENRLKYVYDDAEYNQLCGEKKHKPEHEDLMCDIRNDKVYDYKCLFPVLFDFVSALN